MTDRCYRIFFAACAAGLFVALAARADAHPLHASSAQADYNRATHRLEIGIRVFAEDLLAALNAHRDTPPLSFEKTPAVELDAAVRTYVTHKFRVATADGASVALRWVGREFDRTPDAPDRDHDHEDEQTLWLYVEAALPDGIEGAHLHHALLQERFRDQSNLIRVRDGDREVTLAFTRDDGPKVVRFTR